MALSRQMIGGRLNIFQRLVRQWDALHPYNAIQLLHLGEQPDLATLRSAWQWTLNMTGLGRVLMSGGGFQCELLNGQMVHHNVREMAAGARIGECISEELNRPFGESDEVPFRPFVLREDDGTCYAGVTYHHWFADSVSVRLLLREWFLRMYDPGKSRRGPFTPPPGGYWRLFGSQTGSWRLAEGVLSSLRWTARFRRVRRVGSGRFEDLSVRFALHELPEGCVDGLLAWCRERGLTLNDLLLAAMAEACDRHLPFHESGRRPNLGLGTIHDLRPHAREDLSEAFGLYLGFTSVICRPEELGDFERLARSIAEQNATNKATGSAQASIIRMAVGLAAGKVLPQRRLLSFYRKRIPLAAGISNVNLNRSWAAAYHPRPILDYIRVSPTGPMLPLVFTPSTLGHRLHFGLTYRPAILPEERVPGLVQTFRTRLMALAGITAEASA